MAIVVSGDAHPETGRIGLLTGDKETQSVAIELDFSYGDGTTEGDGLEKGDDRLNLNLGNTSRVGDGTFNEIFGKMFTVKHNVNEVSILLDALVTGEGIDGCGFEICSSDAITVSISNGDATDFLIMSGQYIEEYLATLPDGYNENNGIDQFVFLDYSNFNQTMGQPISDNSEVFDFTIRDQTGRRFRENELDELLVAIDLGTVDNGSYEVKDDNIEGTSTVVILGEGLDGSIDTIVIENVDDGLFIV